MGVYEEKSEGRESMVLFFQNLASATVSLHVISHDSRIILIIIFIVTSKMWRNETKTCNTIF